MSDPWTEEGSTEHSQLQKIRSLLAGALTAAPPGQKVTKIGFWEDSEGNVRYIKYYDGETLLFTLTFSDAGEATSESWSITRG